MGYICGLSDYSHGEGTGTTFFSDTLNFYSLLPFFFIAGPGNPGSCLGKSDLIGIEMGLEIPPWTFYISCEGRGFKIFSHTLKC